MMEALKMYKEENERLKKENEELKKQQGNPSQSSQPSQPAKRKPLQLEASSASGDLSELIAGKALATATDTHGNGVEGLRVEFYVKDRKVGAGFTDGNGDVNVQSAQFAGDPQTWVKGLAHGYTARFRGNDEYLPAEANATAGVTIG
ncbi:hypothetical protein [Streptomyces noursei]|uniref:hypothetical protein n=1 Tax=Streptomyces noursei TaxID=1971 RepID=UPI0016775BED|nr:hypothetical protein [Streptomyces noursei]MCZ1014048.1 hypothetical protein [Streptomyces noursei]